MVSIREYTEHDASEVGLLIKNTYSEFNLSFLAQEKQVPFLGPFQFAGSTDPSHIQDLDRVIKSEFVFLAEDQGQIAGILRGRMDRLASLFVVKTHHQRGIGRLLIERFEKEILSRERVFPSSP